MASLFEILGGSPGSRQDSPYKPGILNAYTKSLGGISRRSRATISGGGAMGERISRMQGTGIGSGLIVEEDPNA